MLTRRGGAVRGFVMLAVGLVGAAFVRPHFAAIWAGAIMIALVARVALDLMRRSDRGTDERRRSQLGTILLLAVAGIGFVIVAQITLSYLDPADDNSDQVVGEEQVTDRLSNIFDEVEDRTTQGGSSFDPISIDGPQDWPLAAFRTLTRPLLFEARGLAAALPALEMTALLLVGIFSWRRLANTPKLMLTTPYLVFAAMCVVTFGVAFASIGNLGILTRQRSLVLPLLLVFWCLPPIVFASERARAETDARNDARVRAADEASGRRPAAPLPSPGAERRLPAMTDARTLGIDWSPGEVPALLGLTAIAIYGCVPETDQMPAIGVMLAALFVIELVARQAVRRCSCTPSPSASCCGRASTGPPGGSRPSSARCSRSGRSCSW